MIKCIGSHTVSTSLTELFKRRNITMRACLLFAHILLDCGSIKHLRRDGRTIIAVAGKNRESRLTFIDQSLQTQATRVHRSHNNSGPSISTPSEPLPEKSRVVVDLTQARCHWPTYKTQLLILLCSPPLRYSSTFMVGSEKSSAFATESWGSTFCPTLRTASCHSLEWKI